MASTLLYNILICALGVVAGQGEQTVSIPVGLPDVAPIANLIDQTAAKAKEGVDAAELRTAMNSIERLADAYLDARDAKVDLQEIVNLLSELSTQFNYAIALSTFLEDPLVQEGRKVSVGLYILTECSRLMTLSDNETMTNIIMATTSFTADAVSRGILNAEGIYIYRKEDLGNSKSPSKRWEVTGNVSKGPGGTTWSVSVSHKFGKRLTQRGEWSAGVNVGYSQPGGWSVGGSLSYKWG
ncbi:hypothetical protein BgiMline_021804 [Biomphalaria glabrata]|uniref:Uncharacterized protein LOC106070463 n=1 Tax=Biomphalaria glabrata TaxID=6526 RepID=A0A9W3B731_BIOGL|nr:uncharacterized protein LOC106070463 [Biomphalaria glabrata]